MQVFCCETDPRSVAVVVVVVIAVTVVVVAVAVVIVAVVCFRPTAVAVVVCFTAFESNECLGTCLFACLLICYVPLESLACILALVLDVRMTFSQDMSEKIKARQEVSGTLCCYGSDCACDGSMELKYLCLAASHAPARLVPGLFHHKQCLALSARFHLYCAASSQMLDLKRSHAYDVSCLVPALQKVWHDQERSELTGNGDHQGLSPLH
eukprot:706683-Amphidinium_carterae.1